MIDTLSKFYIAAILGLVATGAFARNPCHALVTLYDSAKCRAIDAKLRAHLTGERHPPEKDGASFDADRVIPPALLKQVETSLWRVRHELLVGEEHSAGEIIEHELDQLNEAIKNLAESVDITVWDPHSAISALKLAHDLRTSYSEIHLVANIVRENLKLFRESQMTLSEFARESEDVLGIALNQSVPRIKALRDNPDTEGTSHGNRSLNLRNTSLRDLVSEVIRSFSFVNAGRAQLDFTASQDVLASVDRTKLEQVLYNLLSNGVKYGKKEKAAKITVKLSRGRFANIHRDDFALRPDQHFRPLSQGISIDKNIDYAIIEVADEGSGIPPEKLEGIFTLNQTGGLDSGGLGIGLPIVQSIAEAHGGFVEVSSLTQATNGRETGTRFRVYLPLSKTEEAPHNVQANDPQKAHPSAVRGPHFVMADQNAPKFLIVDDNAQQLKLMRRLTQLAGASLGAADFESAIQLVKDHPEIRLVFLDRFIDGSKITFEATVKELRETRPDLVIIGLSADDFGRPQGVKGWITKTGTDYISEMMNEMRAIQNIQNQQ